MYIYSEVVILHIIIPNILINTLGVIWIARITISLKQNCYAIYKLTKRLLYKRFIQIYGYCNV